MRSHFKETNYVCVFLWAVMSHAAISSSVRKLPEAARKTCSYLQRNDSGKTLGFQRYRVHTQPPPSSNIVSKFRLL